MQNKELEKRLSGIKCQDEEERGYERDMARILHSSSFRRLQNKMQVFFLGDSDYYRTRLTHTLEVMQIARGIVMHLAKSYPNCKDFLPNQYLVEAICLAHDLGHPPFGHAGERTLYKINKEYGGFEGNAQTFRILTKLETYGDYGLDLRYRTLLGTVKYPIFYRDIKNKNENKPPKCLYDSEKDVFNRLLEGFSKQDVDKFLTSQNGESQHMTLDASIMNLADDIAYACHDLEDAIKFNFFTKRDMEQIINQLEEENECADYLQEIKSWKNELFPNDLPQRQKASLKKNMSKIINFFIRNTKMETMEFDHFILKHRASLKSGCKEIIKKLKTQVYKCCVEDPRNTQLEFKGQKIVDSLFTCFLENPNLLPLEIQRKREELSICDFRREICDYIAGMTDNYALKIYKRIFDANYGSIMDIL